MKNPEIDRHGNKIWYNDKGQCHREDGPAVEWCDGYKSWWFNGEFIDNSIYGYTQEKFERYLRELKIKEYW